MAWPLALATLNRPVRYGTCADRRSSSLIERRAAEPIIPGWVWRRRTIAAVNLALGALGLLMVAPTVFLPTYAQSVLGLAPIAAGFVLSVWTLSWPVSAALSQHVYRRIGFRNTAMLGIGTATLILLAFPFLPYPGEAWQPTLLMLLLGGALGLFQLPLLVGVQSTVGWSERGTATASVLFCRQTGQTIGAALFGAVANGVLAARLGGAGDLDSVTKALGLGRARRARTPSGRGGRPLRLLRRGLRGRTRLPGPAVRGAAPLPGAQEPRGLNPDRDHGTERPRPRRPRGPANGLGPPPCSCHGDVIGMAL